jgi:ubiquitin carboxyl-terminal hydrolase 34
VGVVMHTGTADSGHYYSFIRDREYKYQSSAAAGRRSSDRRSQRQQWYEFNDSTVKPFDVDKLPEESFGGETVTNQYNTFLNDFIEQRTPKRKSAYLLVYERENMQFKTQVQ